MFEQISQISPILFIAKAMRGVCFFIDQQLMDANLNDLMRIVIIGLSGSLFYFSISKLVRLSPFEELVAIICKRN